jgi:hypothetical protein
MNTRSKTKSNNINNALYEVNIDFDEASTAWKANKKYIGNGSYKYLCCGITKTGNKCNRQSLNFVDFCKVHMKNN